jgi:hypothetical protein
MANELRMLGRVIAEGAKSIGTRALAHGVKSIVKDGSRMAGKAKREFNRLVDVLEEMTVVDPEDGSEKDEDWQRRRD